MASLLLPRAVRSSKPYISTHVCTLRATHYRLCRRNIRNYALRVSSDRSIAPFSAISLLLSPSLLSSSPSLSYLPFLPLTLFFYVTSPPLTSSPLLSLTLTLPHPLQYIASHDTTSLHTHLPTHPPTHSNEASPTQSTHSTMRNRRT